MTVPSPPGMVWQKISRDHAPTEAPAESADDRRRPPWGRCKGTQGDRNCTTVHSLLVASNVCFFLSLGKMIKTYQDYVLELETILQRSAWHAFWRIRPARPIGGPKIHTRQRLEAMRQRQQARSNRFSLAISNAFPENFIFVHTKIYQAFLLLTDLKQTSTIPGFHPNDIQ